MHAGDRATFTAGQHLLKAGVEVDLFQRATSPLEDIYVKVVEESRIDQGKEPKGAE